MRHAPIVAMAIVAMAIGGSTATAQSTHQAPAKKATAAEASRAVTGSIVKFDAASNTLTVSVGKREESFMLAPHATMHEGKKAIRASDLHSLAGHRVTVHYMDVHGTKTAESLVVATAAPAKEKPAGTSGTATKKPMGTSGKQYK